VLAAAISSYVGNKATTATSNDSEQRKSSSPLSNSHPEANGSLSLFPTLASKSSSAHADVDKKDRSS